MEDQSHGSDPGKSHWPYAIEFHPHEFCPTSEGEYQRVNNVLTAFQRWIMETEHSPMLSVSQRRSVLKRMAALLLWNHEMAAGNTTSFPSDHWLSASRRLGQYVWTVLNDILMKNASQSFKAVQQISEIFLKEYTSGIADIVHAAIILYTIVLISPSCAVGIVSRADSIRSTLSSVVRSVDAQVNKPSTTPVALAFVFALFGECCRSSAAIADKVTLQRKQASVALPAADDMLKYFIERLCLTHDTSAVRLSAVWTEGWKNVCDQETGHGCGWILSEALERTLILNGLMSLARLRHYSRWIWINGGRSLFLQQPGPRELTIMSDLLRDPDCLASFLASSHDLHQLVELISSMHPVNSTDELSCHGDDGSVMCASLPNTDWKCRPKLSQLTLASQYSGMMVELLTTVLLASEYVLNNVGGSADTARKVVTVLVQNGLQSHAVATASQAARFFIKALAIPGFHSPFGLSDVAGPRALISLISRCCTIWPFPSPAQPLHGSVFSSLAADALKPIETTCPYVALCALRCYFQTAMDEARTSYPDKGANRDEKVQQWDGIHRKSMDGTIYADYVDQFVANGGIAVLNRALLLKRSYGFDVARVGWEFKRPQLPIWGLMFACEVIIVEIFQLCITTYKGRQAIFLLLIPFGTWRCFSEQPLFNLLYRIKPAKDTTDALQAMYRNYAIQTRAVCLRTIIGGLACARDRRQRHVGELSRPLFNQEATVTVTTHNSDPAGHKQEALAEFSALVAFFRQQDLLQHLIAFLQDHAAEVYHHGYDNPICNWACEVEEATILTCQTLLELTTDLSCRQILSALAVFHHEILDVISLDRWGKNGDSLTVRNRTQRMAKVMSQLQRVLFGDATDTQILFCQRPPTEPSTIHPPKPSPGCTITAGMTPKSRIQKIRSIFRTFFGPSGLSVKSKGCGVLTRPAQSSAAKCVTIGMPKAKVQNRPKSFGTFFGPSVLSVKSEGSVQPSTTEINVQRLIMVSRRRPDNMQVFRQVRATLGQRLDQLLLATNASSGPCISWKECDSPGELFNSDIVDHDQLYLRRICLAADCFAFTGQQQKTIVFGKDGVINSFHAQDDGRKIIQAHKCHGDDWCNLKQLWSSPAMPDIFLSSCESYLGRGNQPHSSAIWRNSADNTLFILGRRYFGLTKLRSTNSYTNLAVGEDPAQSLYRGFTVDLETGKRIVQLSYPARDCRSCVWHESYGQIATLRGRKSIILSSIDDSKPCFHPSDTIISHQRTLFDSYTGKFIFKFDEFDSDSYSRGQDVVFHPNGNLVQIDSEVWDLRSLKLTESICTLNRRTTQYSDAGDVLYACDVDKAGVDKYQSHPYPSCIPYRERRKYVDILDSRTFRNLAKIPFVSDISGFLVNQADNCVIFGVTEEDATP